MQRDHLRHAQPGGGGHAGQVFAVVQHRNQYLTARGRALSSGFVTVQPVFRLLSRQQIGVVLQVQRGVGRNDIEYAGKQIGQQVGSPGRAAGRCLPGLVYPGGGRVVRGAFRPGA